MAGEGEKGYATAAAVAAMAAFGLIAWQALAVERGALAQARARIEQAKLAAAADAGVVMAIRGVAIDDPAARWSVDGHARMVEFDRTELSIVIEDERGKAPLNKLDDGQARALFQGAGASGPRLDALVAEYRDWVTDDPSMRDSRAPPPDRPVRHGAFRTVGELAGLKDMDTPLLARIAPAVTTFFENSGGFAPEHATALAVRAMDAVTPPGGESPPADSETDAEGGDAGDDAVEEPAIAQDHPVEEIVDDHLIGRALTVRVTARGADGAQAHRTAMIELTGDPAQPYFVRYVE